MLYKGSLSSRKPMPKKVKKAYDSWRAQVGRCKDTKSEKFKYYGARGISVNYSSREYVGWYLENLKTREWHDPTVGRLDHDGNYCFENIEMQERSDNSRERNVRKPSAGIPVFQTRKKIVAYRDNNIPFITFLSVGAAATHFGRCVPAISNVLAGRAKCLSNGIRFKYAGEKCS